MSAHRRFKDVSLGELRVRRNSQKIHGTNDPVEPVKTVKNGIGQGGLHQNNGEEDCACSAPIGDGHDTRQTNVMARTSPATPTNALVSSSKSESTTKGTLNRRRSGETRARFKRPSLSEQLASIGLSAEKTTAHISSKLGGTKVLYASSSSENESSFRQGTNQDPPLLSTPSVALVVGRLRSKLATNVNFYSDRLEYAFYHPFRPEEIHMRMFYRDMEEASLFPSRKLFQYKIPNYLGHFNGDYIPTNSNHYLQVQLSTSTACTAFRDKVEPHLRRARGGRR